MVDLERILKLECYKIQADVSIFERTDYVMAVLIHADEQDGATTAESLSSNLFPKYGAIGRKLLEFCKNEGLMDEVDQQYRLTEDGRDAIKHGRTPVPYDGVWKIHLAVDSLVPLEYSLLSIERDEDLERGYDRKPVDDQLEPIKLEAKVKALEGRLLQPSFGKAINAVRIDKIWAYGKKLKPDLGVQACWKIEKDESKLILSASPKDEKAESLENAFKLLGIEKKAPIIKINNKIIKMMLKYDPSNKNNLSRIKKIEDATEQIRSNYDVIREEHRLGSANEKSISPPSGITHDEIWEMISKRFHYKWDPKRRCLLAKYNSVKPNERLDMKVRLKAVNLDIEKLGKFRTREMNAPIYPTTDNDAKKWATDQLCKKMESEYMTRERYQKLTRLVAERFPDFKIEFQKRISHVPSEKTSLFWHIQAMEDWNL